MPVTGANPLVANAMRLEQKSRLQIISRPVRGNIFERATKLLKALA
jgi:hypothetical protein